MNPRLATLLGVAAILLAGIGAAQAQETFKIGVLNDQSGLYADLAGLGSVEAAKMAVEDFGGSVLGKKIEVVSADHQNKPDVASSIVNRWFDVDHVEAVFDVPNSGVALAVQAIAKNKNRVFIVSGAAASDLTGKSCSPVGIHWTYDTYALAHGTGTALVKQGGDSWFFLTADYAFGHALERDTTAAITAAGGKVVGSVRVPFPNQDFSSYLLQAQSSGAKVIGLANAGGDTINSIKQAAEFGINKSQTLAGLLVFLTDIRSIGLDTAQGMVLTTAFYWDYNDETRAWSKKFAARYKGAMPTDIQAGVYSAVMHYLKAVRATGSEDATTVVGMMKATPVNDFFAKNGKIRADGRMVHDMYLAQVKKPQDSKYPYDFLKILQVIPGDQAFRPLSQSDCPLVKK
jgi:branched-chain amino acid transport system substrate-binding protein